MNHAGDTTNSEQAGFSLSDLTPDQALQQALGQLFQLAQKHSNEGDLQKAADCYQMILQHAPGDADASFELGQLLAGTDTPLDSLPLLEAAIQASPTNPRYWDAYLSILTAVGDETVVAEALTLRAHFFADPIPEASSDNADSDASSVQPPATNATEKATAAPAIKSNSDIDKLVRLYEAGKLAELEQFARRLINKNPANGMALRFLGMTLFDLHRFKDALGYMQKAVRILPKDGVAHFNLALCYAQLKKLELAENHYREAINFNPEMLEAYNNLGNLLTSLGKVDEAIDCFRMLIAKAPQFVLGHLNLANAYKTQNKLDEAKHEAALAVELAPDFAETHNALGGVLYLCDELKPAQHHLERAIALKPDYAEAYNNLGSLFFQQGEYTKARPYFEKAIQFLPNMGSAYRCLAQISVFASEPWEKSEPYLHKALELNPKDAAANTVMLFLLGERNEISPDALFREHCLFGERLERDLKARRPAHQNDRSTSRRLRIGFVSGDFCNHAVSTFFLPVLEHLFADSSLELFAYDNTGINDETTKAIQSNFHHWHVIHKASDLEVVNQILGDRIDILFDLSGHTSKNRLPVFAYKPAPVQVSWIGYPGTTGLTAMDYFINDRYCLPEGQFDHLFTEKIARLAAVAPFSPYSRANDINSLPALTNGYVTFGSFNRIGKISSEVIPVWSRLLREVPNSQLFFGAMPQNTSYEHIVDAFAKNGITRDRLAFFGRCGMDLYLNQLQKIDICLDTFPYNGGTTTLHGMWMGVPTVSKAGNTVAARTGAGLLSHVGLQRFSTSSNDGFVEEGVYWATHLQELAELRAGLRQRMQASPLRHPELIAATLTQSMRIMWQRWCEGLAPVSFEVREAPEGTEASAMRAAELAHSGGSDGG